MDRQAFKQRMQNLKSYREDNPGKGYWDWKVEAFADGGQTGDPSLQAIEQRAWLNNWLKNRSKQMSENIDFYSNQTRYGSDMDRIHVSPFFFQDKEENASKIIQEQLQHANNTAIYDYREPWVSSNKNIPNRKEFLKMNSNVQGAYHKKYGQPNTISISPIATDRSVILHELSHSTQDKYSIQSSKIDDILKKYEKENNNYDKYYDNPDEIYSRMNQFRYDNNIKPEDIITEDQIEQWKDSSIDNEFINRYSTNTLLDLLNSVAYTSNKRVQRIANGGEIGDPEKERFYQATGRSGSGRPLEEGLKPVFSLEDAANMTPIGDAISAKDTYDAVKNRDWLGAGLAALTVIPFVPNTIKRVTPTVRRAGTDQIDRILRAQNKEAKMATRLNNEIYNIAERLMDDPSYMRRAQQVKNKYGDDYTSIYADIINAYNESPELLPKAKGSLSLGEARGKMQTQGSATTRHKEGGDFPKIGEYDYMFNIDRGVPYGSTTHEINHFSDFLKNQSPDAVGSSNMYKWMRSAIKPHSDSVSKYFSSPTEQRAYMNQLREFMYANKMIDTRDQVVTPSLIKTALDKLPKGMDSVKKASDQFKSLKSYTKWFNTVPLLGVGAIGANKYFTNNESRN